MMSNEMIKELGDGLILRRANIDDTDALATFNGSVHRDPGVEEPNEFVDTLVRDMMMGRHPTLQPSDFTLVIDTKSGKIVSSMNLIPQTWSYDGIEFGVGRPELVGTHPDYRRRGLIREQFEVIHQWSEQRGHKMQAITGIPNYYRQFGYEMCLNLGGSRAGYRLNVPELGEDEQEKYIFRPVEREDIPFIADVYHHSAQRSLIWCVRTEETWKQEIFDRNEKTTAAWMIIENLECEPLGVVCHAKELWSPMINLWGYELKPGISYLEVTPSLLRYLDKTGLEFAAKKEDVDFQGYVLELGGDHPAYEVLPERMPRVNKPYAWYIRVPNLVDFLKHIKPVFEKRLAESAAVGYSGDFKLNFYRSGVRLQFHQGNLIKVEAYLPESHRDGDVLFPDMSFLQVLVGYRTFEELCNLLPDCGARNDRGRALVKFLFPKKSSHILPL